LDKFCNFGYSPLDDNGAAVVQGTDELISATIRNLLYPVAILVMSCCGFTTLFMLFRNSKIIKYAVIVTFVAVQITAFE
jgi:hypothetical protein